MLESSKSMPDAVELVMTSKCQMGGSVQHKKAPARAKKANSFNGAPSKSEGSVRTKARKTDMLRSSVSFVDPSIIKKGESDQTSFDDSSDFSKDSDQALFKKARQLLNTGCFYRSIMQLYAERKLVVFFGIHFVSTMIIWGTKWI
jgi:hypothetical protein